MAALSKAKLGGIGLPSWFTKSLEDVYREKYGGRYPGLAENVAAGVGTGMKAVGFPKHIAETTGRNITSLAEDWTPAGALTATEEYGPLGALAALPLVGGKGRRLAKGLGEGIVEKAGRANVERPVASVTDLTDPHTAAAKGRGEPVVKSKASNTEIPVSSKVDPVAPQGLGIRAYHGSPHSFDEFDISKIGTGEGAQAYGHGLYMAENPAVGRDYRESTMAAKGMPQDMKIGSKPITDVYRDLELRADNMPAKAVQGHYDKMALLEDLMHEGDVLAVRQRISEGAYSPEVADWFEKQVAPNFNRKGTLYEVDIAADPEAFLDWDRPLSEQPHIQTALEQHYRSQPDAEDVLWRQPGREINLAKEFPDETERAIVEQFLRKRQYGKLQPRWQHEMESVRPQKAALEQTDVLKQAGIPGIKYLDQGSRTAGDGSRNYVVFDPKIISIVRKYGLAAAIASGVISEEMGRQMQEQGEL